LRNTQAPRGLVGRLVEAQLETELELRIGLDASADHREHRLVEAQATFVLPVGVVGGANGRGGRRHRNGHRRRDGSRRGKPHQHRWRVEVDRVDAYLAPEVGRHCADIIDAHELALMQNELRRHRRLATKFHVDRGTELHRKEDCWRRVMEHLNCHVSTSGAGGF
jgi:hypothetical protein